MDKTIVVILALFAVYCLMSKSKFEDVKTVYQQNYDNQVNPPGCNLSVEDRPYPSGKVPGSYLGLSRQEKEMLLIKFLDYNGSLPQYQTT